MKLTVKFDKPHEKNGFYVSHPMEKDPIKFLLDHLPKDKDKKYEVLLEFDNK